MSKKTFAFDIDGVICDTQNGDYKNSVPNMKSIKKINDLHAKGNKIIIFTARYMGRTNNNVRRVYEIGYDFTVKQLKTWHVKYDQLIMGKPSFDLLIDDKAINYNENWIYQI